MSEKIAYVPETLVQAADSLKNRMPFYGQVLDFYRKIFTAQEASKIEIDLAPVTIGETVLAVKIKERLPLVVPAEFAIDDKASEKLFDEICRIAVDENEPLKLSVEILSSARAEDALDLPALFRATIENDLEALSVAAETLSIDSEQLSFFLYNSIKPSLAICAEQLASYLPEETRHDEGYCPVCGGAPALAILAGEGGQRSFNCARCTHTWEVGRRFCPSCNNKESKTLSYFYAETEKEFRVDVCDKCKKYIKTVDTRDLGRKIYPPMELVASLHLDMKATENGYTSGAAEDTSNK